MQPKLGFIGGGNMAAALLGGLTSGGPLAHVPVVVEPSAAARAEVEARFGVRTLPAADPSLAGCTALLLAVKPQQMKSAVTAIAPYVGDALVVSIAAGVRCAAILHWLGRAAPIVRSMPNTPALIGAGITGLYAGAGVTAVQRELANSLLGSVGATVWVDDEPLLDAVTAVSGSGPAYVFYLIESLEKAARELGLPDDASAQLALATFGGAVRLAEHSGEPLRTLRERVTSKGGTTAAALGQLERDRVAEHIADAVRAAAQRAHALGEEFKGG